jgi:hypothetical protein
MMRNILLATMLTLGVAACASTPSQIATDAATIDAGLSAELPAIARLAGINADTVTRLQTDLATVHAAATALAAVTVGQAPVSAVQILVTAVNDAVALATQPPLNALIPPQIETVFVAAHALLPAIEAAAGLSAATTGTTMAPDAARLVLMSAAH